MDKTPEQVLAACTIDGFIVRLPEEQLERPLYLEVAKKLELIGGKWKSGKTKGFVFSQDPSELLQQIANGERRNLKKEFQFFATPDELADHLVKLAEIEYTHKILEPSAGQGAIINAIHRDLPGKTVDYFELMELNRTFLSKIADTYYIADDFLIHHHDDHGAYDRIIANPPFTKNQDIDHIYRMYEKLVIGGRIVSIASSHWEFSRSKKETTFRTWLQHVGANIQEIPAGAFKKSGTLITSRIITINK